MEGVRSLDLLQWVYYEIIRVRTQVILLFLYILPFQHKFKTTRVEDMMIHKLGKRQGRQGEIYLKREIV